MKDKGLSKRIASDGLMIAIAMIFGFVESLIPFNFTIPGIKLGLPNLVVLFMLCNLNKKDALLVNVVRVMLVGILFGNLNSLAFSISGALFSFCTMLLLCSLTNIHIVVISMFGAITHVVGQLLIGLVWYPVKVIAYYSVFLLVAALITGILLGIIADRINVFYKSFTV